MLSCARAAQGLFTLPAVAAAGEFYCSATATSTGAAPPYSSTAKSVAIPRNEKNPATSVTVVRMMEDAVAGS